MLIFWKLLEKILVSVLVSIVLAFASFSFMTGHFPPRKADINQAIHLGKQMFSETQEFNKANQDLEAQQSGGRTVSMEQMMKLQELGLKRMKTSIELMNILKKFPQGVPNTLIQVKLVSVSGHLDAATKGLLEVQQLLSKTPEVSQ